MALAPMTPPPQQQQRRRKRRRKKSKPRSRKRRCWRWRRRRRRRQRQRPTREKAKAKAKSTKGVGIYWLQRIVKLDFGWSNLVEILPPETRKRRSSNESSTRKPKKTESPNKIGKMKSRKCSSFSIKWTRRWKTPGRADVRRLRI